MATRRFVKRGFRRPRIEGMRSGRRIQWQRGTLTFTQASNDGQDMVVGSDWQNTSGEGIERGCTILGIKLIVTQAIIDTVAAPVLALGLFHGQTGTSNSWNTNFTTLDMVDLSIPQGQATIYNSGTPGEETFAAYERSVKVRRRLDTNQKLFAQFQDSSVHTTFVGTVYYSVLLAAP